MYNYKVNKDESLIEYKVPNKIYKEYYKRLDKPDPFYVIIPSDGGTPELMFLPGSKGDEEVESFVFFKQSDALRYLENMTRLKLIGKGAAIAWNCSAKTLFYIIEEQISKHYQGNNKSVTVTTLAKIDGEFRDVEVFWTSNQLKTQ